MRILVLAILVGLVAVTMARSKPSLNKVLRDQKKARRLLAASNSNSASSEESSEVGVSDFYEDRLSRRLAGGRRRLSGSRSGSRSGTSYRNRRLSRFPRRFGDDLDQFNNVESYRPRNLVGGYPTSDFHGLPRGLNRNVHQNIFSPPRRLYNNGFSNPTTYNRFSQQSRSFPRHLQYKIEPMIPRI